MDPDPRVPGFLGRVLDGDVPAGTCFQVAAGVLATAFHVLDDVGAAVVGAMVRVDPLQGGPTREARVERLDPLHDLAVLVTDTPLPWSVTGLTASDDITLATSVLVTGVVDLPDPGHTYRDWQAGGTWAGGTTRDDQIRLGRIEAKAVMRGMSGAPVLVDGRVVAVVLARYHSIDGFARDTVWVARSEDLAALLTGRTELRLARRARSTYGYPLNLGNGSFVRLTSPYEDLPRERDISLTPIAALRDNYGLVPFLGRELELRDLADWTREAAGFAVVSITGRSGVGKSRLARELCAQFIPLGWHVGFAEAVNPTGVHGALELEKPALIVVDIDSDSRNANLAINIIESLSAKMLTHPVRLIVITRALAGEAWDRIRRAAEPRGLCTGRQIALDRTVLGRADQSAQYRAAFEAFSARMGSDQPRKIGSSAWLDVKDGELRHALVEPIEGRINFDRLGRATIVGRNAVNPRSILGNRVYGTPRSILLAHIAALLDVLDGGSGRTETVGPRLLDELIRREAVYWENMFGPLGIADDLQLDIVAAASFATADTKSDARRLLRSLEELSGATEERLGAIAFALHKLYPGDGKYVVSVQPDLVTERLVVPRLLENNQLRRILDNLRSASQCAHIIDVLNRAMLNPAVGHAAEILRAREIVLGRCGDAFREA